MKGLVVTTEAGITRANIENGVTTAFVDWNTDGFSLSVAGMESESRVYPVWIEATLKPGDKIKIEVAEFENTSPVCKVKPAQDE